jgi:hypothetical protein
MKETCFRAPVERLVRRAEWSAKMILGWCCHTWFMNTSEPLKLTPIESWALSLAGFYAYDTGFDDWLTRTPNVELTGRGTGKPKNKTASSPRSG